MRWIPWAKVGVHALCLVPLALLVSRGFNHGLGANPIEYITHSTGWWTFTLVLITLTVTVAMRALEKKVRVPGYMGAEEK